jgi:hypothetical protein
VQLEQQLQQLDEQRAHVALQLEQLEGCDGEKDQLGISDLKQQLQVGTCLTGNIPMDSSRSNCSSNAIYVATVVGMLEG